MLQRMSEDLEFSECRTCTLSLLRPQLTDRVPMQLTLLPRNRIRIVESLTSPRSPCRITRRRLEESQSLSILCS